MLWGIYSAICGEVNASVEKCVEIKGDYVEKQQSCFISVTFKVGQARNFWTLLRTSTNQTNMYKKHCALPSYCVASSCNLLQTFRDDLSVPFSGFSTPEDNTVGSSRNVDIKITSTRRIITQTCAVLMHLAAEARNHPLFMTLFIDIFQ